MPKQPFEVVLHSRMLVQHLKYLIIPYKLLPKQYKLDQQIQVGIVLQLLRLNANLFDVDTLRLLQMVCLQE